MTPATKKKLRANLAKPRKQVKGAPKARVAALKKALEQEAVALEERAKKLRTAAELL